MQHVLVAVGIVLRQGQTFITLRPDDKHQGGKWEFPGGKVEAGETTFAALKRELDEEIGIEVKHSTAFMRIEHDYGDKQVTLDIHIIDDFSNEPYGREQQQGRWVAIDALQSSQFPAANAPIVEKLQQSDWLAV